MKFTTILLITALYLFGCTPPEQASMSSAKTNPSKTEAVASGIFIENMDKSVEPGDNFFRYVNVHWLDSVPIPDDRATYGMWSILVDESQEDVMEIINTSAQGHFSQGTDEQKIGDLYNAYMNSSKPMNYR